MVVPMDDKQNIKPTKYKIFALSVALIIPVTAIVISIYLVKRGISINQYIFGFNKNNQNKETIVEEKDYSFSVFKNNLKPILTSPSKLKIKSISLDLLLVPVGVEPDGTMETPDDWYTGGWFMQGGLPGETKNLIINGHYDSNTGAGAAFFNLKNIKEGDQVEVVDEYGRIFYYKVLELSYVSILDPERLQILEDEEGKSTLTLITCGGVWTGSGYDKRLVVKAELQDKFKRS